ncbi:MAG: molybdopterin-dependent oxidoreductase [Alphaproteobacteria bacterium]|nr:molybdopterin-dependent oxidoreductase [Alphaproteobacteria bacterium]
MQPIRASSRLQNYQPTTFYPLARGKVCYVGEPVAAVLAENRYVAEDARDRIEIAYEPLEAVIDPEMVLGNDAPLLHEEAGTNVLAMREFARGDVEAERAGAAIRVGGRFRFHRKTPLAIENRACIAEIRPRASATNLDQYLHELTSFPNGRHDDKVDSTAQLLDWFKRGACPASNAGIVELYRQRREASPSARPGPLRPPPRAARRLPGPADLRHPLHRRRRWHDQRDGIGRSTAAARRVGQGQHRRPGRTRRYRLPMMVHYPREVVTRRARFVPSSTPAIP